VRKAAGVIADNALTPYRRSGVRMLVGLLWLSWVALVLCGLALGNDKLGIAALLGALVLVEPTRGLVARRTDPVLRLSLGVAAAVHPALLVAMLEGVSWQMDLHMYFFVALTMLLPLCDWRPILLCGGLVALHHLLLLYLVPQWVFSGSGSIGRVLLHGGLVAGEVVILIYITQRFRALVLAGDHARAEAEESRGVAETSRAEAQHSLEALRVAQNLSERRLAERNAAEAALATERQERRVAIAADIQDRVGAVAAELLQAAHSLASHEGALADISTRLLHGSQALRNASEKALTNVLSVSASAGQLDQAAGDAGDNALAASRIVAQTGTTVQGLEPRMVALRAQIDDARGILDLVSEIAAQSNLLALNATIEAARSGEAGKGFGVVAHEMKAMAKRTAAATVQIASRLENIAAAASSFAATIEATMAHMGSAGTSTLAVSAAVAQQRQAIAAISRVADMAMHESSAADDRSRLIGEAATENRELATRTAELARVLESRARTLGENMDQLLGDLRAA
jgi:methyl-accepting chemotaxis protein